MIRRPPRENASIPGSLDILKRWRLDSATLHPRGACYSHFPEFWSGDRSKAAALGLKSLLESTFPEAFDVFISEHTQPGEPWARRLESELEQSQFGVLCLTQDNFQAPWLLYEAGLSRKDLPLIEWSHI